eukprot:g619.t1
MHASKVSKKRLEDLERVNDFTSQMFRAYNEKQNERKEQNCTYDSITIDPENYEQLGQGGFGVVYKVWSNVETSQRSIEGYEDRNVGDKISITDDNGDSNECFVQRRDEEIEYKNYLSCRSSYAMKVNTAGGSKIEAAHEFIIQKYLTEKCHDKSIVKALKFEEIDAESAVFLQELISSQKGKDTLYSFHETYVELEKEQRRKIMEKAETGVDLTEKDFQLLVDRHRNMMSVLFLTIRFVTQIVNSLQCLHNNNVVHGDVSPKNIFLEARKTSYAPYLGDFGNSNFYMEMREYNEYKESKTVELTNENFPKTDKVKLYVDLMEEYLPGTTSLHPQGDTNVTYFVPGKQPEWASGTYPYAPPEGGIPGTFNTIDDVDEVPLSTYDTFAIARTLFDTLIPAIYPITEKLEPEIWKEKDIGWLHPPATVPLDRSAARRGYRSSAEFTIAFAMGDEESNFCPFSLNYFLKTHVFPKYRNLTFEPDESLNDIVKRYLESQGSTLKIFEFEGESFEVGGETLYLEGKDEMICILFRYIFHRILLPAMNEDLSERLKENDVLKRLKDTSQYITHYTKYLLPNIEEIKMGSSKHIKNLEIYLRHRSARKDESIKQFNKKKEEAEEAAAKKKAKEEAAAKKKAEAAAKEEKEKFRLGNTGTNPKHIQMKRLLRSHITGR